MNESDYLTIEEARHLIVPQSVTRERMRVFIKEGRFRGAIKRGPLWFIPRRSLIEFNHQRTKEIKKRETSG